MSKRVFFHTFRGEEMKIGYDISIEYDTVMGEWWFADLNGPEVEALNVTPEEDESILSACVADLETLSHD